MRLLPDSTSRPHLVLLGLLAACSDYQFAPEGEAGEGALGGPAIAVDPLVIDFGQREPGEAVSPRLITVESIGDELLHIEEIALVQGEGDFTLSAWTEGHLEPGASGSLTVGFEAGSTATGTVEIWSDDPDQPVVEVLLRGAVGGPEITVDPVLHDFGTLTVGDTDAVAITVRNDGDAELRVSDLAWDPSSSELTLDTAKDLNGSLPWTLQPGEQKVVEVAYAPTNDSADEALLQVASNDPDEPLVDVFLTGSARDFEGFSTGWYVLDDGIAYETTSNPSYVVDHHGDSDLYWYEPSGAHGLLGSSDPEADFATMRDYVIARAAGPYAASSPFDYDGDSDLATYEYATFTYFLCDFWLPADDDPGRYEIVSGAVDDGIQVMVNGEILGRITLGQTGSWPLDNAVPGEVNTLIIILVDDSRVDKYIHDLGFYRDGVFVSG